MFTEKISPKAVAAFALPFIAGVVLWLITGNSDYLVALLVAAVTGGGGAVLAPPAPGVRQKDVVDLAQPGLSAAQVKAVYARIAKRKMFG
jgi:hypothetical protein